MFLQFSCAPAPSSKPNCIYNSCSKSGQKFGKEFDKPQVPPIFFSGKKPDLENPGKFRILNFLYLMTDFKNGQQKVAIYGII